MKLIVGLGNPGSQYEKTRHNAGFMVLDALAQGPQAGSWRLAHDGFIFPMTLENQKVLLLKPQTFMNLSGRSVASAMSFYKIPICDLLVVVDDLALPCGSIRMRASGSAGGHNGLIDIQRALGNQAASEGRSAQDFARLRLGIDAPGPVPQKNYVLEPFSSGQKSALMGALDKAQQAVGLWVSRGIDAAMNRFNSDEVSRRQ